jgi:hypothetical protein
MLPPEYMARPIFNQGYCLFSISSSSRKITWLRRMKRPVEDLAAELSLLTKEQLIERIIKQESRPTVMQHPKKRKDRPMDFSLYSKQHVAMRVAYLGWDYHGYASQISFKAASIPQDSYQISHLPTIEVTRL